MEPGSVSALQKAHSSFFGKGKFTKRNIQAANSPRNIRLLRDWLHECSTDHDECRRGVYSGQTYNEIQSSTVLPFRVVDVGPSDGSERPRLLTTSRLETGRYLTLSHCWGKVEPPKTTKATVHAWHESLPDEHLSNTFRDAVSITRELGERFLWIDSLCIVQDDPDDLKAQIELMGEIFEGSYCTIAALDAKGVNGSAETDRGLFSSGLHKLRNAHFLLRGENDEPQGELHEVFIHEALASFRIPLWLQNRAWHVRGWVFQERLLSRRCIFFTEAKLAWRCNRYWETEQTAIPECREKRGTLDPTTTNTFGDYTYGVGHTLRKMWQGCVEDYSTTKLTYNSDKDKAIKGLGERFSTRFGAKICFGILEFGTQDLLHTQLLWIPVEARGSSLRTDPNFRCPSWSWMVVDGPVRWTHDEYLTQPEAISQVRFGDDPVDGRQDLNISGVFRTLNISTTIGDIPPSSQFERWPPEIHFGWSEQDLNSKANRISSDTGDEMIGWVVLDTSEEPDDVVAVPLQQYFRLDDEVEPVCIDFLALKKVSVLESSRTQERYTRVGRGRVLKGAFSWLEDCQPRSFIVV
ncbi:Fc.00g077200.m01.CDS01 [Cosmosporella sp. VM-42]